MCVSYFKAKGQEGFREHSQSQPLYTHISKLNSSVE